MPSALSEAPTEAHVAWDPPADRDVHVWIHDSEVPAPAILERYRRDDSSVLSFARTSRGKPILERTELRLSVTHSGSLSLLALSRGMEIGVDLERVRPIARIDGVARRVLSDDIAARLVRLPHDEKDRAFLREWVRHEAIAKARGSGLPGTAFCRRDDLDRAYTSETTGGVEVTNLELPPGWIGALAVAGSAGSISVRTFQLP